MGFWGSVKKVAKVAAAPIILPTVVAVKGLQTVAGLLTPDAADAPVAPVASAEASTSPEVDTTKSILKQDVTAKAVAAAQVSEAKKIKARKGTGATILTNPMGITKAATVTKPTLGLSNTEGKNLLGL